jgi:hypothetical protein
MNSSQTSAPVKLVEEPNPVDKDEAANRVLFSDMYKNGTAKSSKEMMDMSRKAMQSGDIPVGSSLGPVFFAHNTGGPLKGVRVTVSGSAIDQGILAKPQIIINSDSLAPLIVALSKSKDFYRQALKMSQYVGEPRMEAVNGLPVWSVDAPDFQLGENAQLRVAMNCDAVRPGAGGFVFSVYSLSNPGQALLRHTESIKIRETIADTLRRGDVEKIEQLRKSYGRGTARGAE